MYKDYQIKLNAILDKHRKVTLKDIQTLERLSSEADVLSDKFFSLEDDVQGDVNALEMRLEDKAKYAEKLKEASDDLKANEDDIIIAKQNIDKLKDEQKFAKSYIKDVMSDVKDTEKGVKEWTKKVGVGKKQIKDLLSKASKVASELKAGIATFEKTAKSLGLGSEIASKLSEYKASYSDILATSKQRPNF